MSCEKLKILFITLFFATVIISCAQKEILPPPPEPSISEKLDQLYETNKLAWREEIKKLLLDETSEIPIRHLRLAMKAFNNQEDKDYCLEAMWRYLKIRAGNGPVLPTEADRELLEKYADIALSTNNQLMIQRMKKLCIILEGERICDAFRK